MAGPPSRGASLLHLLEPGWRRHLSAGGLAGTLEVETAVRDTVARAKIGRASCRERVSNCV